MRSIFANRVSEMSIQQFSSSKTSAASKSSNEDCLFSLSCTDEPASFLRSPWISRLCPAMPQPISCKEPEQVGKLTLSREVDTDKRLVVSPFFQCQQQMATKFPTKGENNIRSYQEPTVDHLAASSSQLVAKRIGSACHDRGGIPAAKSTFGDLTSQLHHGKQTVGILGEEEEPYSFWNLGRPERSNFVSSVSPLRTLTIANGRKRSIHTYDSASLKLRKLDSED